MFVGKQQNLYGSFQVFWIKCRESHKHDRIQSKTWSYSIWGILPSLHSYSEHKPLTFCKIRMEKWIWIERFISSLLHISQEMFVTIIFVKFHCFIVAHAILYSTEYNLMRLLNVCSIYDQKKTFTYLFSKYLYLCCFFDYVQIK